MDSAALVLAPAARSAYCTLGGAFFVARACTPLGRAALRASARAVCRRYYGGPLVAAADRRESPPDVPTKVARVAVRCTRLASAHVPVCRGAVRAFLPALDLDPGRGRSAR